MSELTEEYTQFSGTRFPRQYSFWAIAGASWQQLLGPGFFWEVVQGFNYVDDICACVRTGLCFNLTSCSSSAGGLRVKGAAILILLRKCRLASESLK